MSDDLRRISIDELTEGMFVADVLNKDGVLLLTADTLIAGAEQIEKLKRQGVSFLNINLQKGMDVAAASAPQGIGPDRAPADKAAAARKREFEYYKELEQARVIHHKTVATAKEALDSIKNGQSFTISKIEEAAQEIVESILRNPDALISLSQIKGYDEYTYTHSVNVSVLATSLAYTMGYKPDRLLEVGVGGVLHDIGKMKIPTEVLNKPGKYTDEEFTVMKKHPELGMAIVADKKGISDFSKSIIIQHHERYNGKGYPFGLKGNEIAEIGLIAAVADVYDALTSNRVYRVAWTPQKALAVIFQGCDQDYSREIVERFTRQMGIYPVGSFVKLATGEMGVVTRVDRGNLLEPTVLVLFDKSGKRRLAPEEFDLSKKILPSTGGKYKVEVSLNPRAFDVDVSKFIDQKYF
jgi:putative nucleotidyltransferase with HDIG domain